MKYWISLFALPLFTHAMPENPQFLQGIGEWRGEGKEREIRVGENAWIDWHSFSLAPDESLRFVQPSQSALALNRVVGGGASEILGRLSSNGQIWILNPSGVLIGKGAVIDTGSFLASTLPIEGDPFAGGKAAFSGEGGALQVDGQVFARNGDLILIGPAEVNGSLEAKNGTIRLADGLRAVYEIGRGIFVEPSPGHIAALGSIVGGHVELYARAVSVDGLIEATGIQEDKGRIYLVAEEGTALVTGELYARGGEARILGEKVALLGSVEVSGHKGGTVLIGGDFQGENPDIMNAKATFVGPEAMIFADGKANAGKVIVWSDESTRCYGTISTTSRHGDGGFIEVSGSYLDYAGKVLGKSPHGQATQLLLDPTNITISNAGDNNITAAPNFEPNGGASVLTPATLTAALAGLVDVTVSSTNTFDAGEPGDIIIVDPISYSSGRNLTFTTQVSGVTSGTISVGAAVTNMGPSSGAIRFFSQGGVAINSQVSTDVGMIEIQTQSGDINIQSMASGASLITTTGAIEIANLGGNMNILAGAGPGLPAFISGGGPVDISIAGGDLIITAGPDALGEARIDAAGNMTISVSGDTYINGGGSGGGTNVAHISTAVGIGSLSLACRDIFLQAGSNDGCTAEIISGTNTNTVTARNIALNGATGGGLPGTFYSKCARIGANSGGAVNVTASGNVSLTGGTNDYSGSFIGMADEAPGNFCGPVNLSVSGNLTCTGGAADQCPASIISEDGLLNLFVGGDLSLISGTALSSSTVIAGRNTGPVQAVIAGSAHFQSNGNLAESLVRVGSGGLSSLSFTVGGDFLADATIANAGEVGMSTGSGSPLFFSVAQNASLNSTLSNIQTDIQSAGNLTMSVGGNLSLIAQVGGGQSTLTAGDSANISIGGNLSMSGAGTLIVLAVNDMTVNAGGNISIDSSGGLGGMASQAGAILVEAQGSISLLNQGAVFGFGLGPNTITLIAGTNIDMSGTSQITNNFIGGEVNLVVDNLFPTSPLFGPGSFIMGSNATITSGSPLRVFTSQRSQNNIQGLLNGVPFIPGTFLQNTNTEQWGVYYFNSFFGDEFYTIFYKTGVQQLGFFAFQSYIDEAEMLRNLHPFSEYIGWALHFKNVYQFKSESEDRYFLRRRYVKGATFAPY